jgi:uncharacterized protein (TIGR02599 family)
MKTQPRVAAFTLVELMVSTAIISLLLILLVQMTAQTSATWQYTTAKAEQFREARNGFETMSRRIAQATLNTYWDYDNPELPRSYVRQSELRFICGPMQSGTRLDSGSSVPRPTHGIFFQAPFGFTGDKNSAAFEGLESLLNTWGYYLEVQDDAAFRPPHVLPSISPLRVRSRLMEMMQPTASMNIYRYTSGLPGMSASAIVNLRSYKGLEWFRGALTSSTNNQNSAETLSHPLATNIVALAILPKLSEQDAEANGLTDEEKDTILAPNYYYHSAEIGAAKNGGARAGLLNSKHQLPPVIQVTMVAIDETSARRLNVESPTEDPLKVRDANFLTTAANYSEDLLYKQTGGGGDSSLERRMIDQKLNYRIFSSNIYLRGAKWSKEQTK